MLEEGIEAIHIVGIDPPTLDPRRGARAGQRGTAFVR